MPGMKLGGDAGQSLGEERDFIMLVRAASRR